MLWLAYSRTVIDRVAVIDRAWRCMAVTAAGVALSAAGRLIVETVWMRVAFDSNNLLHTGPLACVPLTVWAILASYRRLQTRAQGWLASIGGEISSAAAVSALLGGLEPAAALETATARFCAVSASSISLDVLSAVGTAEAAEAIKTTVAASPAMLGVVDAFVSHSWRDDAVGKHAALREWCDQFEAQHGREPVVWFDRLSLRAANGLARTGADLVNSLVCLPIFVAGCRRLV
jgi:hypothetical protein